jgi:uncharacterized C2H2 Zn-finger protein
MVGSRDVVRTLYQGVIFLKCLKCDACFKYSKTKFRPIT